MRSSRGLKVFAVLAAFTMLAAACSKKKAGGGGGGGNRIEVTVYGQGAWTGGANTLVLPSMQSAQLHFDELNKEEGYPATITFKQADTQGSGDQAPPVAQEAAQDPDTVAIMGPAFSGESRATGDTYNDAQIPFITASATAVDLAEFNWDYWYRAVGNDDAQGRLAADYVADVLKPKSLFILHDTTDYGKPLAETVEKGARAAGIKIAGKTGIAEPAINTGTTVNFSSIISQIQASGADTVFFGGYDVDSGPFLSQAAEAGLHINFMSGDGSVSSVFLEQAGGTGSEGARLVAPSNISADFVAKYAAAEGGDALSVPIYASEGYDVAGLIGEGIKQAIEDGAASAEEIRAGIKKHLDSLTSNQPYVGVAKDYAFDPDTHELVTSADELYYFYQVRNQALVNLGNATEVLG